MQRAASAAQPLYRSRFRWSNGPHKAFLAMSRDGEAEWLAYADAPVDERTTLLWLPGGAFISHDAWELGVAKATQILRTHTARTPHAHRTAHRTPHLHWDWDTCRTHAMHTPCVFRATTRA